MAKRRVDLPSLLSKASFNVWTPSGRLSSAKYEPLSTDWSESTVAVQLRAERLTKGPNTLGPKEQDQA